MHAERLAVSRNAMKVSSFTMVHILVASDIFVPPRSGMVHDTPYNNHHCPSSFLHLIGIC